MKGMLKSVRRVLPGRFLRGGVLVACLAAILPGCGGQPANRVTVPDKPIALPDPKTRVQLGSGSNSPAQSRKLDGVSAGAK